MPSYIGNNSANHWQRNVYLLQSVCSKWAAAASSSTKGDGAQKSTRRCGEVWLDLKQEPFVVHLSEALRTSQWLVILLIRAENTQIIVLPNGEQTHDTLTHPPLMSFCGVKLRWNHLVLIIVRDHNLTPPLRWLEHETNTSEKTLILVSGSWVTMETDFLFPSPLPVRFV